MRRVATATFDDIAMIGSWLCEEDRRELSVTRDPDDYVSLARDAMRSPIHKVVLDEIVPVFAFGANPLDTDTAIVWGFKTEAGWAAVRTVTKYIRTAMIPELRAMGIRRAVCFVHTDNTRSQRWLEHLGFRPRATTDGIGTRPMLLFQRDEPDAAPQRH